jgi:hypothetical protein
MYKYIRDPKNNRKISVTSKRGKYILKKYLDFCHGGADAEERLNIAQVPSRKRFRGDPEEAPLLSKKRFRRGHKEAPEEHPRNDDGDMGRVHSDDDPNATPQNKADIYDLDPNDEDVQKYLNEKNLVVNKREGDLNCKHLFSSLYNEEKNCIEDEIMRNCIDKTDLMHFPNADMCASRKFMCEWYHQSQRTKLHHLRTPGINESREWWEEQCPLLLDYNNLDDLTIRIAVKKYLENAQNDQQWNGPPINEWGTSEVTDMSDLFHSASNFNQPLNWDTGNVRNMVGMFAGATNFNQPLNWDTSKVEYMSFMFHSATSFNQFLNSWDTSKVEDMSFMFHEASSFNQPLNWDTSKVENMSFMFSLARSFNQSLNWNTGKVKNMESMFAEASSFNQLLDWDTKNVESMKNMFHEASSFNQLLDWDTGSVTNMQGMFWGATNFNQPLDWDIGNVENMSYMFHEATSFNQPLNWDLSRVRDKEKMLDR